MIGPYERQKGMLSSRLGVSVILRIVKWDRMEKNTFKKISEDRA